MQRQTARERGDAFALNAEAISQQQFTPFSQILPDAALALCHFWNFRTQAEQMSSASGSRDSGEGSMSDPLTAPSLTSNMRISFEQIA